MTLDEFETLILTHGPDAARWPEARRGAAEDLLAQDAEAVTMRDAMLSAENLLRKAVAPGASGELAARIAGRPARERTAPAFGRGSLAFGSIAALSLPAAGWFGAQALFTGAVAQSLAVPGVADGALVLLGVVQ